MYSSVLSFIPLPFGKDISTDEWLVLLAVERDCEEEEEEAVCMDSVLGILLVEVESVTVDKNEMDSMTAKRVQPRSVFSRTMMYMDELLLLLCCEDGTCIGVDMLAYR